MTTPLTENTCLSELLIDEVADALQQQGFIQLTEFLPAWLATDLQQEAKRLSSIAFKPAGIGRQKDLQLNSQIRTDMTLWLDGESLQQHTYLKCMEQLREGLNRRLFMGLFDFECHFSHYAKGDFYRRHLDAFKGRSNRILSTVFYLNDNWHKNEGGELVLYADEQQSPLLVVPPLFNNCIIFLSDVFPHEVLTSHSDRYSIAGWYRLNNNTTTHLDPSQ
ncbi:2OG-Fe(II) oxygenase [uncultured Paraglaciecola sp.]|uniref:2OG-Fe(II) oxygenase n=1 Tax=uncultured Paraglaciecola sp. TaxID=1765024 RepID=UPI0030D7E4D9|tara:strand:- start:20467 stop:21126 length:660 start_codon:yes stop_codon:yes gene_type:complete